MLLDITKRPMKKQNCPHCEPLSYGIALQDPNQESPAPKMASVSVATLDWGEALLSRSLLSQG
jgi:hypothetical protein